MQKEYFCCDEIAYMLVVKNGDEPDNVGFTINDGSLDWDAVNSYFKEDVVFHNLPLSYEHCRRMCSKFHVFIKRCPRAPCFPQKYKWTNRVNLILMASEPTIGNLPAVLTLSSILEYSLGNIYLTRTGAIPPHLLRDLLMTDTLADELGENIIYLLRLLLGSPNGINLRNLVWHGFLSEENVSPYYRNFLLLALNIIGEIVENRHIKLNFRCSPQNTTHLFQKMNLTNFNELQLLRSLEQNSFISSSQIDSWKYSIQFYKEKKYYFCISLALAQLEMYLRCFYSHLYQRDFRAKLDEYYITLDTVFEEYNSFTNERNRIYLQYCNSILELAYDILSATNGPRIRDKLSHGELQLHHVDNIVAESVLYACYVIINNDPNFSYKSLFHPNAILRDKLDKCSATVALCHSVNSQGLDFLNVDIIQNIPFIPEVGLTDAIKIFHRPKGEDVIIGILIRTATTLQLAASNLQKTLISKLEANSRRELRSRARKTLNNMVRMFPDIIGALKFILNLLMWIFHCLMLSNELGEQNQILRFLKFILKYTENAANNLDAKNNTWLPLHEATKRDLYEKTRQCLTHLLC